MSCVTVQTKYGLLQGIQVDENIISFKGIPYAKPPVGELRWKRPVKPDPWDGVRCADTFMPKPIQGHKEDEQEYPGYADVPESEDCLYLNIWAPASAEGKNFPVMYWVPGGGFMEGNAAAKMCCGEEFARKGVVLVTLMHRTGALGYMSHPLLADENGQSGNWALYDLLAALDWVHENIAQFHGDPNNVTIAGQSSGCVAIQMLLQSPHARGKFHHAIMQSGRAVESGDDMDTAESSLRKGVQFMQSMGAATKEEMYALDPQEMFSALKAARLPRSAVKSEQDNPGRFLYHVDGEEMLALFDEAAYNGLNADVDILIGSTANDGGAANAQIRSNSCTEWAENQLKLGRKPCYVYLFARERPDDPQGASHTAEVAYQFGNLAGSFRSYTADDYKLSELMVSYWTNFAKTGNPNGAGLPCWQPYTADHRMRMRLDVTSHEEPCRK